MRQYFNNNEKKKWREGQASISELEEIVHRFENLDRKHNDDEPSIKRQLRQFSNNVVKLFDYASRKLNTCAITYFVKCCKRLNNVWHEIANPIYDSLFCNYYNQLIQEKHFNEERQTYLVVARIATHLSYNQVDNVNKMV